MSVTDDPEVRYCSVCDEDVYLCRDADDVFEALQNNRCVAIYDNEGERVALIGDVESAYSFSKPLDFDF